MLTKETVTLLHMSSKGALPPEALLDTDSSGVLEKNSIDFYMSTQSDIIHWPELIM